MCFIFKISTLLFVCFYVGSVMSLQESSHTKFIVYWNVPTFSCKNEKFEKTLNKFHITHNSGDAFRGEEISIFYRPGLFPIVEKKEGEDDIQINGGIPQRGDIEKHLETLEKNLINNLPPDFKGIGVIDFEDWRPIFRQNWNRQVIYRNLSIELGRKTYSDKLKNNKDFLSAVQNDFEEAATEFMEKTLEKAKSLFPEASWGFYGFPYCYNHYSDDKTKCAKGVNEENDRIQGIFNKSDALFPSIYINKTTSQKYRQDLIQGRVVEAKRVWENKNVDKELLVLPYVWIRHLDSNTYLNAAEIEDSLETAKKYNAGGVIVWGSSDDVNTDQKCKNLHDFVEKVFGPAVEKVGV